MRPKNPPPAVYPFGYRSQPRSGNEINGLGEHVKRLASPVFHSTGRGGERVPLAWAALDTLFNLLSSPGCFWQVLRTLWQRRLYCGPVAAERVRVDDTAAMAARIKSKAKHLGAGIVGVTRMVDDALYEGYARPPYEYVVSIGTPMDRGEMEWVPQPRAAREVMRTYRRSSRIAIDLAAHIRALGWRARAYADGEDLIQIPLALAAGLGQLGKHGSMISNEHGSNFRLAAVLTDLPLATDVPIDIGVDDLCATCRRCTLDCPPGAIVDDKQMVRGSEKWYVDFDKCVPYFAMTEGCGICIEVCPWSEPGRGAILSETLLAKRTEPNDATR
jgi:Pyruvate/2-oxoacid:ferredoxin oxidoreductase delta subunit